MLRNTLLVRLTLVAVGLIAGLSMVLVVACTQDDPVCQVPSVEAPEPPGVPVVQPELSAEFVAEAKRRGAFIGEARRSANSTTIAYVNGFPITAADIAESRAQVGENLEHMRDTISRVVPDSEAYAWSGEGRQFSDPDAPIPESYGLREDWTARIQLIEGHGVDNVVLASFALDLALFTAATDAGHSCDDDDIAPRVEEIKTLLAEGLVPELEGYLSAVGEEVYFTELVPDSLAQRLTVTSWRREVYDDVIFPEDPRLKWRKAERDALLGARVTITNDSDLNATFEDATAYMEAYWAFDVPPTPSVPTPDWTPAR